ncbi:MAG: class I SAM-dependent methyltransferase [Acidobacteria bacterium]|nr:class I SAM-dependent methyltransferase [Acidobacteriota bacterium]
MLNRSMATWARRLFSSASSPQQASFEARDVIAEGLFPVCPATHDLGIRRLFDLSTLLLLLDCRPGDVVLDLGAGPGFSSEMLARLGYDVVALDPDLESLVHNRRRPTFDPTRIEGKVCVVQGSAERLPFRRESFDGVLGMNVLHHVADLSTTLSELARVLKPGCRATFVEPGLDHLAAEETERARREHGADDRAFDVLAFLHGTCGSRVSRPRRCAARVSRSPRTR